METQADSVGNGYGTIRVHEVEGEKEVYASFSPVMKGRLDADTELSTVDIQDLLGYHVEIV